MRSTGRSASQTTLPAAWASIGLKLFQADVQLWVPAFNPASPAKAGVHVRSRSQLPPAEHWGFRTDPGTPSKASAARLNAASVKQADRRRRINQQIEVAFLVVGAARIARRVRRQWRAMRRLARVQRRLSRHARHAGLAQPPLAANATPALALLRALFARGSRCVLARECDPLRSNRIRRKPGHPGGGRDTALHALRADFVIAADQPTDKGEAGAATRMGPGTQHLRRESAFGSWNNTVEPLRICSQARSSGGRRRWVRVLGRMPRRRGSSNTIGRRA